METGVVGDCVLWEGYTDRRGYAKVSREGRKSIHLHRYLYEKEHGSAQLKDG